MKDKGSHLERLDSYAKLSFQLLVGWFTFFSTVNWASIGWLAANSGHLNSGSSNLMSIVALIFMWQNILGVSICCVSIIYFFKVKQKINIFENDVSGEQINKEIFPFRFYILSIIGMILGLTPLIPLWCYVMIIGRL